MDLRAHSPMCRGPAGRAPPANKRKAGAGIFWIVDNGGMWNDLPRQFGFKSAGHRCFKRWVDRGVFARIMCVAAQLVEDQGRYGLYACFIDGTLNKAKGGRGGISYMKGGKGVKSRALVDAPTLRIAADQASASPHGSGLVQQLFGWMLTDEVPERAIDDKVYDSDGLDEELTAEAIELIAPHRKRRRPEHTTQAGSPLRRYKRRFTVERSIGWLQRFRRLRIRREKSTDPVPCLPSLGVLGHVLLRAVLG